jgi:hypothetical protein
MKKKVNLYVMRHGHKDAGSGPNDLALLSKMGEEQVLNSTRRNLMGLDFHGLYCSLKYRTLQTVVLATSLLKRRNNGLGIAARIGFDYEGAPDLGEQFIHDKKKIEQKAKEQDVRVSIGMWRDVSPRMVDFLRIRLIHEIEGIAVNHCLEDNKDEEINILSGSHEVVGELACVDPISMPPMREADIVKYVLNVERTQGDIGAEIISSEYIDRGF